MDNGPKLVLGAGLQGGKLASRPRGSASEFPTEAKA